MLQLVSSRLLGGMCVRLAVQNEFQKKDRVIERELYRFCIVRETT